jgi:glutathione S-transferase
MAGKSDFSAEEWNMLRQGPFMASMLVIAASPSGPAGLKKEMAAANRVIAEAAYSARTPLLQSLGQDLKQTSSFPWLDEGHRSFHDMAVAILKQVCGLLERKASPEEADEMKQWLNTIARRTAEAAKEGGFLGVGGTLVSDQEQEALDTIKSALDSRAT